MFSVNNSFKPTNVIYFKGIDKSVNENSDSLSTPYSSSSEAMTSYGKVLLTRTKTPYEILLDKLSATSDNESISAEDAVKEFSDMDYNNKTKTDFIMACTYENLDTEPEINKKALLTLKESLIYRGNTPKLTDVIRTCLDEENKKFNSAKFNSMFNPNGKVKISARLKPRKSNYDKDMRDAKAERYIKIFNLIEAQNLKSNTVNGNFKTSDLFVPLDSIKSDVQDELNSIKNIPDDLRMSMNKAIDKNDFNLRQVHADYYSLLNDCQTISDIEMFYPELEYPKEKPVSDSHKSSVSLDNRLANEDFDGIVIDILKKSYIDIKPKEDIRIPLEHSRPTTYKSLAKAGYEFSYPSKEIQQLLNKTDKIVAKYKDMPDMTDEDIEKTYQKHAIRKSKVWTDYHEMTRKDWLPVRLIKNKRLKPTDSEYSTDKLVNTYLLKLYQRDPNGDYTTNPLEVYEHQKGLSRPAKAIINNVYYTRYKKADTNINDMEFINFSSKFDKKAIGKSIEAMENNYTKAFFRGYWTKERFDSLKHELQNSSDLVYEKLLLKEQVTPKIITNDDVNKLIEKDLESEESSSINENQLATFKYTISKIHNHELKKRCLDCIQDPQNINISYFETLNKIIQSSLDETGSLNEDKVIVHLTLHDKFLHKLFNSGEDISEEDFINKELATYRSETSDVINYRAIRQDMEAETKYLSKVDKLMDNCDFELPYLLENKFVSDNEDYKSANHVLDLYESIPDTFKDKFVSVLRNNDMDNSKVIIAKLDKLQQKISSWNYDNDDILIMDKETIPQKVVITHNAKKELLDMVGGNLEKFDNYYKKFYASAQHRTGDEGGQGVKILKYEKGLDAEIKIKGRGGGLRMYAKTASEDELRKYETGDGINVKYIFNNCDDHL